MNSYEPFVNNFGSNSEDIQANGEPDDLFNKLMINLRDN